jgi:hypothetical protein
MTFKMDEARFYPFYTQRVDGNDPVAKATV